MQKLSTQALATLAQDSELVIRSLAPSLYRAEITSAGQTFILADAKGQSAVFPSCEAIKRFCYANHFFPSRVFLHQHVTYSEMIGLGSEPPEAMKISLNWTQAT